MTARAPIDINAYQPSDLLESELEALALDGAYDPLAEDGADAPATLDDMRAAAPDEEDVLPYLGDPEANHAPEIVVDERPAAVRTAELFDRMKTRRRVLLGVLAQCAEPTEAHVLHARVEELQADQRSVFDGPAICGLLERAGAIEQVKDAAQEPKTVVVDGVEYLEPAGEIAVRYRITEAGSAQLASYQPAARLAEALEREAYYKPIYLRILQACAEEGGKSAKELGALVDTDPLLQEPRLWAAHFFNVLGECDALDWHGTWKATDLGLRAIEELELEGICA